MRTGIFGSYCQKKQTEHSIRPVSSALFSYQYDSFADRVQMPRATGLYARRPVRCDHLPQPHCRLRLTWSREHALWTPQQWSCVMFPTSPGLVCSLILPDFNMESARYPLPPHENTTERHYYGGAG
ncbi:transposable element Tcb1 transposase [Trichonephila clavipes]|nr:transposable element Tcb1 transposase [Trichonephila clavipes]